MDEPYVPIARYLPRQEAWPMAGRLQAEGIDARVVRQQESISGYEPHGGAALSWYMVIVPEREAARALWVLEGLGPEGPGAGTGG